MQPEHSMEPDQASAEAMFEEALKLPAGERAAFVAQACRGDDHLHQRLLRLLEAEAEAGSFLGEPVSLGATIGIPEIKAAWDGEQPGDRIGRYKLLQKIGEGGMGAVYMAEQEEPVRRRVAFKIIKLGMDTRQVVARFEAERQALALMVHPNIAQVLDGGATQAGRPYFVMELVQGVPIAEFCDKNKLRARDRLKLFIQVCNAIQSAHQKGIIHRDIKPSNVLVTLHHGEPMAKVIDFGIAKATNQKLTEKTLFTQHATMIGTPAYMSPEQAEVSSMDVDTRTDVYALGVLLYELLTGTTPFPEKRLRSLAYGEMQRVIMEEEPERPSTRLSTMGNEQKTAIARNRGEELAALSKLLKGDLDWIVMKCLEKDRTRRYETASGLAADVQRHLSDEPVTASPPSALYRLRKIVRRNRSASIGIAAVAAVLILGVIVSTQLAVWALRERAGAVQARSESEQKAEAEARAKLEAREQRDRAELEEARSRERLVRLDVANGVRLLDSGDHFRALLWFHEALKNDASDAERSRIHRLRLGAVLDAAPKLVQVLRADGAIKDLGLSSDGKELVAIYQDPGDENKRRWQLFDVESGKSRSPQQSHSDRVLAYHSKSSELLVASNGVALVRHAQTGEPLATLRGLVGPVDRAALSPAAAAVLVVQSNSVRIWSTRSGEPLTPLLPQPGDVDDVEFSLDGSRFAVATTIMAKWIEEPSFSISITESGPIQVWDTRAGEPIAPAIKLNDKLSDPRIQCVFSPDGKLLLLSENGDQVRGLNLETNAAIGVIILGEYRGPINQVTFSPDGRSFATAHGDSTRRGGARIWETQTGKPLKSLMEDGAVNQVVFSPGGDLLTTVNADNSAQVWDVEKGASLTPLLWHEADIAAVAFAPDGRRLITGTAAGMIRIWDLAGQKAPHLLQHGRGGVEHAEFSRDGGRLLTAGGDGRARLWDLRTGELLIPPIHHPPLRPHRGSGTGRVRTVTFSPDETRVLSEAGGALTGFEVRVWDALTGETLLSIPDASVGGFSPDSRWIASESNNIVHLWNADTGSSRIQLQHPGNLKTFRFRPDGSSLLTLGDKKVRLWSVSDGTDVGGLASEDGMADHAVFTPDGSRIAIVREDGTIHFRDASTGHPEYSLPKHAPAVNRLSFSPDGRKLLAISGGLVRILDANSGQPLGPSLQHASEVSARFSPDSRLIATWSQDAKKVWRWDAATSQPMGPPIHHDRAVDEVAFHPDSLRLLTADDTGARIWAFAAENGRLEDLELLYRLLSSANIDESGSIAALDADALSSIWARLRANHKIDLSVSKQAQSAWYHERATAFEAKREWPFAIFYLKRLIETNPTDLKAQERLVRAEAELGKPQL